MSFEAKTTSPLNNQIIKLWGAYPKIFGELIPQFYGSMKQGGLLVIGANPSFIEPEKQFRQLQKWTANTASAPLFSSLVDFTAFYKRPYTVSFPESDIIKATAVQDLFQANYQYFTKFKDLQKACGTACWQHIDLFQVRLTKLAELKAQIAGMSTSCRAGFIEGSIEILTALIQTIKPELILVENAYAGTLLRKFAGGLFRPLLQINIHKGTPVGTYFIENSENEVPVFYSSMLTGQRALDLGSFSRLQWNMAFALGRLSPSWRPVLDETSSYADGHLRP